MAVCLSISAQLNNAQPPLIEQLSPTSQIAGQSFTLTVTGQRFCIGSYVVFNGEQLFPTTQSATQLTAFIDGELTTGLAGDVPVQIQNSPFASACPGPGLSSNIVAFRIGPPPLNVVTNSLPDAILNTNYSQFVQVTGGVPPYSYSLSGTLPQGMTFNGQTGLLSGVPTQSGSFPITVTFRDSAEQSVPKQYTLNVRGPLDMLTNSLPAATLNTAYTFQLSAVGGTTPYVWSLLGGGPQGLTMSQGGVLSGTPTQSGSFNLQVRVSDAANAQVTRTLALTVNGPQLQLVTQSLPPATAGIAYTTTLAASGGVLPYTFTTSSTLPSGLTLSSSGVLSGTTGAGGSFSLTFTVKDAINQTASKTLALNVTSSLQIQTLSLPQAPVAAPYSTTITATGGAPPYVWSAPGGLPSGFVLDSATGILSGTAQQSGVFSFNVQVQDSLNQTALRAFQLVAGTPLNITTSFVNNGLVGQFYQEFFAAAGGTPPYNWSAQSALPPGLFLNPSTGGLGGTPTLAGIFNLSIRVTDSFGASASRSYSMTVMPAFTITTQTLAAGTLGLFYEQTLVASGGTQPYFWSLSGNTVPGLVLNQFTGVLSGTPSQSGTFTILVQATDSAGQRTSKQLTLTVGQLITITPATVPNGTVGAAYSQTFTAAGGLAPYTFVIAGPVPGLSMNTATGVLSGTPTQAGLFEFTIRVTDGAGQLGLRSYTLTIVSYPQITTTSLPDGVERTPYSQTLAASGGVTPYTWRITSGSLPDGLQLNTSSGVISGTPSAATTVTLAVELTDATGQKSTRALRLTILPGLSVQTSGTLPNGAVGTAYSFALSARGGSAPYRWRVRDGSLPEGLQLAGDTGQISGTPTRTGRFPATVEVTDSAGQSAAAEIIININPALLRITSGAVLPGATAGQSYQTTLTAAGGVPPYRWSLNRAPAGLTIDETNGVISGRVDTPGIHEFSVRLTDSTQVAVNQEVALTVTLPPAPPVNITGLPANGSPGQQLSPRLNIGQAYPVALSGELILLFRSAVNVDDPAIQFSTGGRRAPFTIAAGQTEAVFNASALGIQTGTVAGTIDVTARITATGLDITPSPTPVSSIVIPRAAPVINSVRLNRTANGFELVVIAYATSRDITSASVRLATSGAVQGTEFTVNLSAVTGPWYQGTASQPFGSLCTITIPFTVQQGTSGQVTSATVTLTNSVGTSQPATGSF